MRIRLPNGWAPRPYQRPAWDYLERGGKHCELIWHRRSGKDEIALHRAACAAFERVATYWHMLPLATQARKAIWEAINPHTGRRRIDESFPPEIRETTREQEMMIRFKNGSTWQVVGSDNFNSLVGSPPAGIVYSEWALANPSARAYLRPILMENGGWQMFITTPRGRNHAHRTYEAAKKDPNAFAQRLSALDTGIWLPEQLEDERQRYREDFGEDQGDALFEQELMCSFDAAIMGSYYGKELARAEKEGRLCEFQHDPEYTVYTAWDLGFSDDTSIWFWQVIGREVRIIDCHSSSGKDPDFYIDLIRSKPYRYETHWLPHDARAKTLASGGKSIEEQWRTGLMGKGRVRIVPNLAMQDGIQASRKLLNVAFIAIDYCQSGVDALKQYRRKWDDGRKCFLDNPLHDWTSHLSDAFRMMAIAWKEEAIPEAAPPKAAGYSLNDLWASNEKRRR